MIKSKMIIRVTAPKGMMSIPDITSGDYDLDDPEVKKKIDDLDLWSSLTFLEPGQKVLVECIERVDEPCCVCGNESDLIMTIANHDVKLCNGCLGRMVDHDKDVIGKVNDCIIEKMEAGE